MNSKHLFNILAIMTILLHLSCLLLEQTLCKEMSKSYQNHTHQFQHLNKKGFTKQFYR